MTCRYGWGLIRCRRGRGPDLGPSRHPGRRLRGRRGGRRRGRLAATATGWTTGCWCPPGVLRHRRPRSGGPLSDAHLAVLELRLPAHPPLTGSERDLDLAGGAARLDPPSGLRVHLDEVQHVTDLDGDGADVEHRERRRPRRGGQEPLRPSAAGREGELAAATATSPPTSKMARAVMTSVRSVGDPPPFSEGCEGALVQPCGPRDALTPHLPRASPPDRAAASPLISERCQRNGNMLISC
jgi:hypothetical protein